MTADLIRPIAMVDRLSNRHAATPTATARGGAAMGTASNSGGLAVTPAAAEALAATPNASTG